MPANGTARTNRGVTHSLLLLLGETYEWGDDAHTLSISALTFRFRCRSLAAEDQRQGWQEKRNRAATRAGPLTVILVACTMHGGGDTPAAPAATALGPCLDNAVAP
jgi:hypothetical protein